MVNIGDQKVLVDGAEISISELLKQHEISWDSVESEEDSSEDVKPAGPNGFPEETPVAEMTDVQKAAYWKFQTKKADARAKTMLGDVDKALQDGRVEGLKVAVPAKLAARLGVTEAEVAGLLEHLNVDAVVADGAIHDDVLDSIVAAVTGLRAGTAHAAGPGVQGLPVDAAVGGRPMGVKGGSVKAFQEEALKAMRPKQNS